MSKNFVCDENSVLSLFINRSIKTEIPLNEHKYLILFTTLFNEKTINEYNSFLKMIVDNEI